MNICFTNIQKQPQSYMHVTHCEISKNKFGHYKITYRSFKKVMRKCFKQIYYYINLYEIDCIAYIPNPNVALNMCYSIICIILF